MKIKSIYITKFAGKKDLSLDFGDGVNIIRGDNESGKSTVCAFIKFIFYGFDGKAERTRYYGWDSAEASGSAVVSHEGKLYRIERSHTESGGAKFAVYDCATGDRCFRSKKPGEIFLSSVSPDVFENTLFVRQESGGSVDGRSLEEAMENIMFSADESADAEKAVKKLDAARKALLYKNGSGGLIFEEEQRRAELSAALEECRRNNHELLTLGEVRNKCSERMAENRAEAKKLAAEAEGSSKTAQIVPIAKRIEKIGQTRADLESAKNRLSALAERYSFDGFLPDAEYISELEKVSGDYERSRVELEKTKAELSALLSENRKADKVSKQIEAVNSEGGQAAVIEKLDGYDADLKRSSAASVVSFAAAALALIAAAVIFLLKYPVAGLICTMISVILMAAGMKFSSDRKKTAAAKAGYLGRFGMDDGAGLRKFVFGMTEYSSEQKMNRERISRTEEKLARQTAETEDIGKKLDPLLAKWGRRDAAQALEKAREAVFELEKRRNSISEAAAALAALESTVSEEDEKKYRAFTAAGGDISTLPDENAHTVYKARIAALDAEYERLAGEKHEAESRLAVLTATAGDPLALGSELDALTKRICELRTKHDAYLLALEKLGEASDSIRMNEAPGLAADAGRMLSGLTDGRYPEIALTADRGILYRSGMSTHDIAYMSAGTKEVTYTALRSALADHIFGKGAPMIFDESFAMLDDKRLGAVCSLIALRAEEDGAQILIFTSHSREIDMFEKTGRRFDRAELTV